MLEDIWDIPIGNPQSSPFEWLDSMKKEIDSVFSLPLEAMHGTHRTASEVSIRIASTPPFNLLYGLQVFPMDGIMSTVGKVKRWKRKGLRPDKIKDTRREVEGCYRMGDMLIINSNLWDKIKGQIPRTETQQLNRT